MNDVERYFDRQMQHARAMAQGDQREFWQGYCRGLLRGFLGPCPIYDEVHSRMLDQGALDEFARGYGEAFRAIEQLRGAASDPAELRTVSKVLPVSAYPCPNVQTAQGASCTLTEDQ